MEFSSGEKTAITFGLRMFIAERRDMEGALEDSNESGVNDALIESVRAQVTWAKSAITKITGEAL